MMKLALAALLLIAGAVSATAAPTYPWCQRTRITGGSPDCSFNSLNQCRASISGVGGDCVRNPALAYRRNFERPRSYRDR